MKEILIYNIKGDVYFKAFLKEELESHFVVVVDPNFRTHIRFPKNLFSYKYLTEATDVL